MIFSRINWTTLCVLTLVAFHQNLKTQSSINYTIILMCCLKKCFFIVLFLFILVGLVVTGIYFTVIKKKEPTWTDNCGPHLVRPDQIPSSFNWLNITGSSSSSSRARSKSSGCLVSSIFATVSAVEASIRQAHLELKSVDLSEQAVIDCLSLQRSLNICKTGIWPWDSWQFMQTSGVPLEVDYRFGSMVSCILFFFTMFTLWLINTGTDSAVNLLPPSVKLTLKKYLG